jgi:hypothetical protein
LTRPATDAKLRRVPLALNVNAMVMCSHGGQFKFVPTVGTTVMIGGAPALVLNDKGAPMAPCPFAIPPPAGPGPTPCLMITAPPMVGFSMKVFVKGQPLLMQNSQWMTIATPPAPPVPAMVTSPGNMTVNVNG